MKETESSDTVINVREISEGKFLKRSVKLMLMEVSASGKLQFLVSQKLLSGESLLL